MRSAKKLPTIGSPPSRLRIVVKRVKIKERPKVAPIPQAIPAIKFLTKIFLKSSFFGKDDLIELITFINFSFINCGLERT